MSESGILEPGVYLSGSYIVNTSLRPVRLAFLVPDNDLSIVVRVIDSCSLTWGGYSNLIIPYSRKDGLATEWKQIIEVLDPDNIVDCVGILDADREMFSQRHRHVHKWDDPTNTFFTAGALQHSALKAFGEHLRSTTRQHVVINPVIQLSDPLSLHVLARWGRLNESFIEETLRPHRWESIVRYDQFAATEGVEFSGSGQDVFLGNHPDSFPYGRYGTSIDMHNLLSLTLLGLDHDLPSYSMGGGGDTPEIRQYDEGYANCVVVTGEPGDITDLALYWNLRIERQWADPFPLWIPLDILDSDRGQQLVNAALSQIGPRLREGLAPNPPLFVLSSSVAMDTLNAHVLTRFPDCSLRTQDFYKFLTGFSTNCLDRAQREVNFDLGGARIPLASPPALDNFATWDRVV